jgi:DnaJ-class molecular chaperone
MFLFKNLDGTSKKAKAAEILGIPINSSENEIKKAYREAALKWHPDKNVNNKKKSEEKFNEVTKAYNILINKEEIGDNNEDNIVNKIFEDFIFSMNRPSDISEEEEINLEAEELFHMLNEMPFNFSNNFNNPEVFVFGPQSFNFSVPKNKIQSENRIHTQNRVYTEKKSLKYRVRIKLIDIWNNIDKKLLIKNKYYIKLPLYHSDITFKSYSKSKFPDIYVEIIDKVEPDSKFKRRGLWDLEVIHPVSIKNLYEDFDMEIELPNKSIKKIHWKKDYLVNIQNENIKGFFLYDLGLPKPDNTRGKLWVKLNIILPDDLNLVEKNDMGNKKTDEYLIPEWADCKEWQNTSLAERCIVLELDKYL